jgi:predicted Zn-dependent peptidase
MQTETVPARSGPSLARPVFANQDFPLLRKALLHYLKSVEDDPDLMRMSHLYHRLGRLR